MKRVHLFITGKVQGVCFRAETKIRAKFWGLRGFIKNLKDGRVEAVVEGKKDKMNKLINWAKKGPAFARVKDVQIIEEEYRGEYEDFEIIY